jgi:hypothetical protein
MFRLIFIFAGVITGLVLCSVYTPPVSNQKMMPHPKNPGVVFKNPDVENGFFKIRCVESPCPSETDSLNLMSMLHK